MTVDIDQLTETLPASQAREVKLAYRKQAKDETAAFLWCFFLGVIGAHRFYLRQWARALLHLQVLLIAALVVVAGIIVSAPPLLIAALVAPFVLAALIWTFFDLAHIDDEVSERNLRIAERLVAAAMLADPQREQQAEALYSSTERQQQAQTATAATDAPAATAASPGEQFEPDRESPPPLDVGVQALTGIAGLGIAGGYRVIAEPAPNAVPNAPPAPADVPTPSVVEPPVAEPAVEPAIEPVAPSWDASTQPAARVRTDAPPARDVTDLGGDLGAVPPVADVEPSGPWLMAPAMPGESGAEDVGLLILEPEPETDTLPAPPIWPAAPEWPSSAEPPEWPVAPDPTSTPAAQAPTTSEPAGDSGTITPEMLAGAAGLAAAGGTGAMGVLNDRPSDTAQTYPPAQPEPAPPSQPTPPHLLKHIRVVRQVKVGDDVVEESVAEAYIDPNDDPEPVRERLREQLRREAEAKQAADDSKNANA